MNARLLAIFVVLMGFWAVPAASAGNITVCVIDTAMPKNPTYFGMATTQTVLKCELGAPQAAQTTLAALYKDGWRLVEIVRNGWVLPPGHMQAISPLYYLERTGK